jgi:hypothetical protein
MRHARLLREHYMDCRCDVDRCAHSEPNAPYRAACTGRCSIGHHEVLPRAFLLKQELVRTPSAHVEQQSLEFGKLRV